ncbi:DUF3107 domain-containing protein [Lysinibacter sp. HNR]|uniref:DUF3107 domain-containing protein n=1 Tax=Lysinibacter sp. HNR TaxID=3031408 RepID=UPI002434F93A|nr:DUF3107 domain-containing protein [Lysinibacter sp. HNR]WGD36385.1 DUF3107 domain-containing protein [Lysinibacter sp. HNR]
MEIRIGIINTPREISFETDESAESFEATINTALEAGKPVVRLTDSKGRIYLVHTGSIAYVEIGNDTARRVGFVG